LNEVAGEWSGDSDLKFEIREPGLKTRNSELETWNLKLETWNMWRILRLLICVMVLLGLRLTFASAGVQGIWAVGDGERIEKFDRSSSLKASNAVWDGEKVSIFGARNEIIAFQVIVESDGEGIDSLTVALPALVHREGKSSMVYAAPELDPTRFDGRPIQLFSVNYVYVSSPTKASWIYRTDLPGAPANPTGWKPVQLVPENAMVGKGGFPLSVEPVQNQAIWIEIYTGRDRPAGVYDGTIQLVADSQEFTIPLELELFNFNLSERNSMHAMVYYEPSQPSLYQGRNLDSEYHRFAHRNRIELVHAYTVQSATEHLERFLGGDFRPEDGYEGPGEGVGNTIIPNTFYGPGSDYDERESAWKTSDEWITFLDDNIASYLTFVYMPDEPSFDQFARIRRIADNIHSNPGPGQRLPVFVTKEWHPALDGWIDYWCTGPWGYDIGRAEAERAQGHEYWIYNGGRPFAGAIVIDAPATDARAIIWSCFKHGIELYFYWHAVHWRHNHQQKPNAEKNQDVWGNPITFDTGSSYANGDGVLIYPGQEVLHPEQNRGIPGPISCMRLANFRRGLQDHQYLALARSMGLDQLVEESLDEVVPKVFSDTDENLGIGFAEGAETFEKARYRLAEAIEEARQLRRRR